MRYRRKNTRPPRLPEVSAAEREMVILRRELAELRAELAAAREELHHVRSFRDILADDLGKLVVELRQERTKVDFLTGRRGVGCEPWDIRRIFG